MVITVTIVTTLTMHGVNSDGRYHFHYRRHGHINILTVLWWPTWQTNPGDSSIGEAHRKWRYCIVQERNLSSAMSINAHIYE